MSPNAHTVARARWAVRVALRLAALAALLMAVWALYGEIGAFRRHLATQSGGGPARWSDSLYFIVTTWRWLIIAALLLAADLFALRLLVPLPRGGCPGCGYEVDESKQERCPECGLELQSTVKPA